MIYATLLQIKSRTFVNALAQPPRSTWGRPTTRSFRRSLRRSWTCRGFPRPRFHGARSFGQTIVRLGFCAAFTVVGFSAETTTATPAFEFLFIRIERDAGTCQATATRPHGDRSSD